MKYILVKLNDYWYVRTPSGKLLGSKLNKLQAIKLQFHLEQVAAD